MATVCVEFVAVAVPTPEHARDGVQCTRIHGNMKVRQHVPSETTWDDRFVKEMGLPEGKKFHLGHIPKGVFNPASDLIGLLANRDVVALDSIPNYDALVALTKANRILFLKEWCSKNAPTSSDVVVCT